jgi:hypothetical protein
MSCYRTAIGRSGAGIFALCPGNYRPNRSGIPMNNDNQFDLGLRIYEIISETKHNPISMNLFILKIEDALEMDLRQYEAWDDTE